MQNNKTKLLYHFTTSESIIKIIENMSLKFSTFENLNDLNENEVNFGFSDSHLHFKIENFIVEHCKLVSFSQDYKQKGKENETGINHPRMWAQYAGNNSGACIVINEKKFKEINSDILKKAFWKMKNVKYKDFVFNGEYEDDVKPKSFIVKEYKKLFFLKHIDWQNEDERRLLYMGDEKYLSINNCIEYICLGNRFQLYDELIDAVINVSNKDKQFLTLHNFKKQINAEGRTSEIDHAAFIRNLLINKRKKINNYINKLNEKGYNL